MATTSDHETGPLGFDPVEVAAAAPTPDPSSGDLPEPDEHPTLVTPRPDPADAAPSAPEQAWSDDILPVPDGGRRARREAAEAHDPRPARSPLGRVVLPLALVLVALVALVAAWNHLQNKDDASLTGGPAVSNGTVTAPSVTASTVPTTSASGRIAPSDGVSGTAPAVSDGATTTSSTTPSTAPSTSASPSTIARPIDRSVPVVVLNATSRTGLAGKVAAQLRAKGWTVTSVGNWSKGGITKTTVYLNGHLNAQATIRKDLPAAKGPVLMPLPSMPKLRMVVVVGDDYPA
jgi:hypothetical protein